MTIPAQKEIGAPILEFLKDGKVHHIEKMAEQVLGIFFGYLESIYNAETVCFSFFIMFMFLIRSEENGVEK